jgi:PKD repeat protein
MGERVTNKNFCPDGGGWSLNNNSGNVNCSIGWDLWEGECNGYMSIVENTGTASFSQDVDLTGVTSLTVSWYHYSYFWYLDSAYTRIYIDDEIVYRALSDSEDYPDNISIDVALDGVHNIRIESHGGNDSYLDVYLYEVSAIGPDLPPAPVAAFTGFPVSGEAPLVVLFTDESTNTPTSWLWDFGDGFFSTERNPFHTFTLAGSYDVALRATNDGGSDLELKPDYITVSEPPPPPIIYYPIWSIPIGRLP